MIGFLEQLTTVQLAIVCLTSTAIAGIIASTIVAVARTGGKR